MMWCACVVAPGATSLLCFRQWIVLALGAEGADEPRLVIGARLNCYGEGY
jgi:hypothetical protein